MKVIAVLIACLASSIAAPNHYGSPALVRSGYEAPAALVKSSESGYEAPALKSSYGHEAPVFKSTFEAPLVKVAHIPIVSHFMENDNYGTYNFKTEGGDGTHYTETGSLKTINDPEAEGPIVVKTGSYSWTSPEGQLFKVDYVADENGFHATGDHLPVSPPIPAEIRGNLNNYDSYSAPAVVRAAVPTYGVRDEPYKAVRSHY